jgi:hypothetical protein
MRLRTEARQWSLHNLSTPREKIPTAASMGTRRKRKMPDVKVKTASGAGIQKDVQDYLKDNTESFNAGSAAMEQTARTIVRDACTDGKVTSDEYFEASILYTQAKAEADSYNNDGYTSFVRDNVRRKLDIADHMMKALVLPCK